ncbi:MBL fold metallo-hydrolase [Oscillatoria sp. CS-180]|uniref:MBL fold metallo-hydrolase n=1 Tax=Oscillatoria sp. CS-180 TaxID=3021720 RepID=UPI00232C9587|nr:MBL fold metallo-hydrolase [Oscillatoria sp. CS-180]MDB9526817.1 MBL fold metallo-hydrolase [Oscillatoria sp. CS-180]
MSFKQPRSILEGIYSFSPNRATLGGTSYLIVKKDQTGNPANLLIDAPANTPEVLQFIAEHGGVRQWVITHRDASGEAKSLQAALQCDVVIQEQEAYLVPEVANVIAYRDSYSLGSDCEVFWTSGYSPGSACVYWAQQGGVLFTGRHLLPDRDGQLQPLRFAKTFHWPRQLRNVEKLQARFSQKTLAYGCPAANTGFLRGQSIAKDAYAQLAAIDVEAIKGAIALL